MTGVSLRMPGIDPAVVLQTLVSGSILVQISIYTLLLVSSRNACPGPSCLLEKYGFYGRCRCACQISWENGRVYCLPVSAFVNRRPSGINFKLDRVYAYHRQGKETRSILETCYEIKCISLVLLEILKNDLGAHTIQWNT